MVNVELITRRRVALGLSRHDLARASGLSWQALLKLEESGWTDGTHTLNTLRAIAQALGLDPADLLKRKRHQATQEPDAKTVGAALAFNPDGLQDDVLARALDWPADRVQDAIAALAQQLPAVGQTVRHVHGHTQLVPANLTLDTRRLDALARATRPLGHDHARVLLKTLRGTRRENRWENFTTADRVRLIDLIDQGALGDQQDAI